MKFYSIPVCDTASLIGGDAKTVSFEVPADLREIFSWEAGQHLTLRFELDGEEVRRCYTISASPVSGDPLRITVKRVKGGLVSHHINDHIKKGDRIDLLPPSGNFQLVPGEEKRRTHYLMGAGSGITPLYSMLHTVLDAEPYSVAHLLYANRNDQSIIFLEQLADLCAQYPDRLSVSHVLSSPRLLSAFHYWKSGKITPELVGRWISEHPPYAQDCQYYLCGPGTMNRDLKKALQGLDVPSERVHFESFGGDGGEATDTLVSCDAVAQIGLNGVNQAISVAQGETILEAVRSHGLRPPYSCQSGVCGQCQAELRSGTAAMRSCAALSQEEVEKGKILTCQALATSEELEVVYPQ